MNARPWWILLLGVWLWAGLAQAQDPVTLTDWHHTQAVDRAERPPLNAETVEAFADGLVRGGRDAFHIPGVVVTVVKDGEVLLTKGYGYADDANQIPVDPAKTRFHVASISKTFTFTAVMQLVERGELSLEDPVAPLLGIEALDDGREPVLVRQLLSHNAGFEGRGLGIFMAEDEETDWPLLDYVREVEHRRVRDGDERIVYSNFGSDVAGAVVESVSGVPFETYMQQSLLTPVGMNDSAFMDGPIPAEGEPHRAVGHKWKGGKYLAERKRYNHHGNYPAGGLATTGTDMAKYMLAHLGPAEQNPLLEAETLSTLYSVLARNHESVTANRHGFWDYDLWGYSTLGHNGSIKGFRSSMVMIPELGLGVFVAANSTSGTRLTKGFAGRLVRTFFEPKRQLPVVDPERDLSEFDGNYLPLRRNYTKVGRVRTHPTKLTSAGGYLLIHGTRAPSRWIPAEGDVFVHQGSGETIAFIRDEDGRPTMYVTGSNAKERVGALEDPRNLEDPLTLLVLMGAWLIYVTIRRRVRGVAQASRSRLCAGLILGMSAAWIGAALILERVRTTSEADVTPAWHVHYPSLVNLVGHWLLIVLVPLTLGAAATLVSTWKKRDWTVLERVVASAFVGVSAATLLWMTKFNLIGFHYG